MTQPSIAEDGENESASTAFGAARLPADPAGDLSLVGIVSALLRRRALVLATGLLVAIPTFIIVLLGGRSYTSDAAFILDTRNKPSNLSGLAAQFGISVPAGDAGQSPDFFVALLDSRSVLPAVVKSDYFYHKEGKVIHGTLLDELVPDHSRAERERMDDALHRLRRAMNAEYDAKTGIVHLSLRMPSADLAAGVVSRALKEVNRFNLEQRQSQSAVERRFTEAQMVSSQHDLRAAEDSLQQFLQQNRTLSNSPSLSFREQRMTREVARRQQLYTALSQAFEQARMEEVRDTPALTIVEAPEVPVRADPRGALTKTVLALVLGLVAGAALALLLELSAGTAGSAETRELSALWRATVTDFRHPLRAVTRASRLQHK